MSFSWTSTTRRAVSPADINSGLREIRLFWLIVRYLNRCVGLDDWCHPKPNGGSRPASRGVPLGNPPYRAGVCFGPGSRHGDTHANASRSDVVTVAVGRLFPVLGAKRRYPADLANLSILSGARIWLIHGRPTAEPCHGGSRALARDARDRVPPGPRARSAHRSVGDLDSGLAGLVERRLGQPRSLSERRHHPPPGDWSPRAEEVNGTAPVIGRETMPRWSCPSSRRRPQTADRGTGRCGTRSMTP